MIVTKENKKIEQPLYYETKVGEIYLDSFKNGVLYVKPTPGCHIEDFVIIVAELFEEIENLNKVSLNFDDTIVVVEKQNADPECIFNLWCKARGKTN